RSMDEHWRSVRLRRIQFRGGYLPLLVGSCAKEVAGQGKERLDDLIAFVFCILFLFCVRLCIFIARILFSAFIFLPCTSLDCGGWTRFFLSLFSIDRSVTI